MCISSLLTLTAVFDPMVTAWLFLLKEHSDTLFPIIDATITLPNYFASYALTEEAATPVAMLLNDCSGKRGFLSTRYFKIHLASVSSLMILVGVASLCCSLVAYVISVSSCIALLISPHAGEERIHTRR
ncbi:unnamed protein product [Owenia fusiformis]|uniref:Uncharacterized protein n=1 Tax=Owenia fusiformis TaxID=6347 RepID=A0A8S4PIN1_OWEFU|nr:unnamed protein product [Owenia fusiformis]